MKKKSLVTVRSLDAEQLNIFFGGLPHGIMNKNVVDDLQAHIKRLQKLRDEESKKGSKYLVSWIRIDIDRARAAIKKGDLGEMILLRDQISRVV